MKPGGYIELVLSFHEPRVRHLQLKGGGLRPDTKWTIHLGEDVPNELAVRMPFVHSLRPSQKHSHQATEGFSVIDMPFNKNAGILHTDFPRSEVSVCCTH